MALISTKNIAAPFTNKTNLVTLILVVVAFLFLRLAGGKIDLVNADEEAASRDTPRNSYYDNSSRKAAKEPTEEGTRSLEDLEELFK